jgi:DNA-binding transcriptional MerR regulator
MAELSRRSRTPVATIKYYIREGLLAPGTLTAANQAVYGDEHVERIELIRALREVAGLSIGTIRETFAALTSARAGEQPTHLGVALQALSRPLDVPPEDEENYERAAQRVAALLASLDWQVRGDSSAQADLVRAVVAIERHFPGGVSDQKLAAYAAAAQGLAQLEIPDTWNPRSAPTDTLRYAVLGTVLFEPVILALRRMAHEDRHRRLTASRS